VNTSGNSASQLSNLADALRQFRRQHRLSQNQLALRVGVTQQTIARWEQGAPPRADMVPIIQAVLEGGTQQVTTLATVIRMSSANRTPASDPVRQEEFLSACVELVLRGESVPGEILLLAARHLGLL
jgi:transcriptional regulator with XRE-family HTH domain